MVHWDVLGERLHTLRRRNQWTLKEIAAEEGGREFLHFASRQACLSRPGHCHSDLERQASSAAHGKPAYGRHSPAPRLESSARTALLLERLNSPRFMRVSGLVSRPLAKKCDVGRETVVLPNSAARDEPAQSRSIGVRKRL